MQSESKKALKSSVGISTYKVANFLSENFVCHSTLSLLEDFATNYMVKKLDMILPFGKDVLLSEKVHFGCFTTMNVPLLLQSNSSIAIQSC